MATHTSTQQFTTKHKASLSISSWTKIGLLTSLAAIVAVLITQVVALSIWPEAAAFKPLDSYPRTILFTLVPALVATGLFAWLNRTKDNAIKTFLIISVVVLLASFIPDYMLPDPNRTLIASSIAAFLHVVAGIVTVGMLILLKRNWEKRHS